MADKQTLSLTVEGTDIVSATQGSIPVLITMHAVDLDQKVVMAVNFLRCGHPAVQLLINTGISNFREDLAELIEQIQDSETEMLGYEGKETKGAYNIFRLFRDPGPAK